MLFAISTWVRFRWPTMCIVLQNPRYSGSKFYPDYETTKIIFYSNLAPSICPRCNSCHLTFWHKPSLLWWAGSCNSTQSSTTFFISFTSCSPTLLTTSSPHWHLQKHSVNYIITLQNMSWLLTSGGFHNEPISSILVFLNSSGACTSTCPSNTVLTRTWSI